MPVTKDEVADILVAAMIVMFVGCFLVMELEARVNKLDLRVLELEATARKQAGLSSPLAGDEARIRANTTALRPQATPT
jgi:hypothetical protein